VDAFISYTHDDDSWSGGLIRLITQRLAGELSLLAGAKQELWMDIDHLAWGTEFDRRIEDALLNSQFFIPFMTPAYFDSDYCRKELQAFTGVADRLGLSELVFPIYFSTVPSMSDSDGSDPLIRRMSQVQRSDWRELRHQSLSGEQCRQEIAHMAAGMLARRELADGKAPSPISPSRRAAVLGHADPARAGTVPVGQMAGPTSGDDPDVDELAALAKRIADAEEIWSKVTPALNSITAHLNEQASATSAAAEEIRAGSAVGKPVSASISADLRLANRLGPISVGLWDAAHHYAELGLQLQDRAGDLFAVLEGRSDLVRVATPVLRSLSAGLELTERSIRTRAEVDESHERLASKVMRPIEARFREANRLTNDGQRALLYVGEMARAILAENTDPSSGLQD